MNMPTPQQEHFYRHLAKLCDLTVVYTANVAEERRNLGWSIYPHGYTHYFQGDFSLTQRYLLNRADFHFLSGLPGSIHNLTRVLFASSRQRIGVQAELRSPEAETARRQLQSILYSKILKLHGAAFFGIGQRMRDYYQKLGVPSNRVFPFAYFSPTAEKTGAAFDGPVLFVGRLVQTKGVDILLRAFADAQIRAKRKLALVGDGIDRNQLQALTRELGLHDQVQFVGVVEQRHVTSFMNKASVLVLPSRHDGWGFVVNEALSVGLPVIVSDRCGAAEVIQANSGGIVFQSGNTEQLAFALDELLVSEDAWCRHSQAALATHRTVSADTGGRYFIQIVEHVLSGYASERPLVPWLSGVQQAKRDEA